MKTVVVFSWFYLPFIGGAELFVKAVTDRLAGRFRFVIVTARAERSLPKIEESEHVRILRTGFGRGVDKYIYPLSAIRRSLSLPRVDLVHSIMVNASAVAAYGLTRLRPCPTLLTLQEGDSEDYVRDYLGPLFPIYPRLHRPFDRIHSISHFLKDQAVGYGADRTTIRVVPNGVDTDIFSPGPSNEELRDALELSNKRVLVSVSRLVPKNGIDIVVAALPLLLAQYPETVLVLVGDGSERRTLEARAEKVGVRGAVRFVGSVEHERTVDYLRLADVFVRPSRSEGLGSAFLEAMAAGVPVVATAVGGIPDFIRDGETGLFAESGSAESVARAVGRVLSDGALANRLSESGLTLVRSSYRWEMVAEQIAGLYEELLRE